MLVCRLRPSMVAKAANAIVSGMVLGLRLQPYEAHLPFLLQFKLDMNLYGMAHMVMRTVEFRKVPESSGVQAGLTLDCLLWCVCERGCVLKRLT
jgi:hypothetical protein